MRIDLWIADDGRLKLGKDVWVEACMEQWGYSLVEALQAVQVARPDLVAQSKRLYEAIHDGTASFPVPPEQLK